MQNTPRGASLASWQTYTDTTITALPDLNSLENQALSTLAENAASEDYTIPTGSPALAFKADGSNAGPYQFGNEIIGVVV